MDEEEAMREALSLSLAGGDDDGVAVNRCV